MPLIERTYQIIAGVLWLLIFGTPQIGVNYNSPFYTHLVDITNGTQTITDISGNAPNWGYAVPLPQVEGLSGTNATSSGSIATSTTYSFAIAALDQLGTTTLSNILTTTSPSQLGTINLSWSAVAGAQAYALFFATGTVSTSAGLTQYMLATTKRRARGISLGSSDIKRKPPRGNSTFLVRPT